MSWTSGWMLDIKIKKKKKLSKEKKLTQDCTWFLKSLNEKKDGQQELRGWHKVMFLGMSVCASTFQPSCQSVSPNPDLSSRWWFRMRDQSCRLGYGAVCVCVCVCVQSLCGVFFSKENLHSRPPAYHLLVPHTPGLVHVQLCSAVRQLGQQLTRAAASPSYISAFRKRLSNIRFSLRSLKPQICWPKSLKTGGHSLIILFQCTSIYVNWGHLGVKSSAAKLIFSSSFRLPLLWANKSNW